MEINVEGDLPNLPRLKFNKKGNLLAASTEDGGVKILANPDSLKSMRVVDATDPKSGVNVIIARSMENNRSIETVHSLQCQIVTMPERVFPNKKGIISWQLLDMKATQQLIPSPVRSVIAPAGRPENAVSQPSVSSWSKNLTLKSEQSVLRSWRIQNLLEEKWLELEHGTLDLHHIACFSLNVKINSSSWQSQIVKFCKFFCVEILSPSRSIHCLSTELMKNRKDDTMNPHQRSWTLISFEPKPS